MTTPSTTAADRETVIRPSGAWLALDWRSLVAYRDLLWLLVQRDFTAKYKQTILGPVWFFLSPLITTVVFTLVFSRVIGVPTDGVPPLLFYLCGMLGWSYFSNVLGATGNSLAGNAHLFSKVFFPRLIPPLAVTISSLIALGIQLLTFFIFYAQDRIWTHTATVADPTFAWILFPVLLLHMGLLALGVGLILSSMTAKYRDLQQIQGFLVQLWMYGTPVIYPLSKIPESWQWLALANPMTAIVEATRTLFLGTGSFHPQQYAVSLGVSVFLFLVGVIIYQRTARTFVDTV